MILDLLQRVCKSLDENKIPNISEIDLKVELFKTFYRFDFDKETLTRIAEQMNQFLTGKKTE